MQSNSSSSAPITHRLVTREGRATAAATKAQQQSRNAPHLHDTHHSLVSPHSDQHIDESGHREQPQHVVIAPRPSLHGCACGVCVSAAAGCNVCGVCMQGCSLFAVCVYACVCVCAHVCVRVCVRVRVRGRHEEGIYRPRPAQHLTMHGAAKSLK
jgi:hypothetical protein